MRAAIVLLFAFIAIHWRTVVSLGQLETRAEARPISATAIADTLEVSSTRLPAATVARTAATRAAGRRAALSPPASARAASPIRRAGAGR